MRTALIVLLLVALVSTGAVALVAHRDNQRLLANVAKENAADVIQLVRLRDSVPPSSQPAFTDQIDTQIFGKLVQLELRADFLDEEMKKRLGREFAKLKTTWTKAAPRGVSQQSIEFVEKLCRLNAGCPGGQIRPREV
jgi:hypothetical protein